MITEKDREEAVSVIISYLGGGTEAVEKELSIYRAESAEQARKEAAERVACAWREYGEDITLRTIRTAILDDSTTDHIPDTRERLAIAVKALEKINERHSFADIVDDSYIISRDALMEIQ